MPRQSSCSGFVPLIFKQKLLCLIIVPVLLLIAGCTQKIDLEKAKADMMTADREFSQLSEAEGTAAAFYHTIADDGHVLPSSGEPLTKDTYQQLMTQVAKGKRHSILKWQPIFADIASSGDFGYTHGRYEYTNKDSLGNEQKRYGYYVTIWKKQSDGSWRFVFDAGNECP